MIQFKENEVKSWMIKEYALINYSFYFTSVDNSKI